jgi:hypothetical protein
MANIVNYLKELKRFLIMAELQLPKSTASRHNDLNDRQLKLAPTGCNSAEKGSSEKPPC